jgi:ABC-type transport system involved in multi-copper enzyme maturation permease subunit
MTALLRMELRRAAARRLLKGMFALDLLAVLITGLVLLAHADEGFKLSSFGDIVGGITGVTVLAMWTFGASFIGADWRFGTVGTLLTWEPRRTRVLVAKALAAAIVAIVATLLMDALMVGGMLPAVLTKGTTDGIRLGHFLGITLRGAALGGIAALLGFAISSVARNSAFGLGAGLVYLVILENILQGFFPWLRKWLVVGNSIVFVSGQPQPDIVGRSVIAAGLVLLSYAVIAVAIAVAFFRARDVT